jgi:AraC-like DNA-binding protein
MQRSTTLEFLAPEFIEREPPVAAQSAVQVLWSFWNPPGGRDPLDHVVPADGCFSLVLRRLASGEVTPLVLGPHDAARPVHVSAGARYIGARFWPDSGGACLDVDAVAWTGRVGAPPDQVTAQLSPVIRALAGPCADECGLDALGGWCAERFAMVTYDPVVRLAVLAIGQSQGRVPVRDIATLVRCGERQLLRRFKAATGLTPKRYSRVRRFREAALMHLRVPRLTWSRIAAEVGYADHAHLAREFQAITGEPPHAVARRVQRISHQVLSP